MFAGERRRLPLPVAQSPSSAAGSPMRHRRLAALVAESGHRLAGDSSALALILSAMRYLGGSKPGSTPEKVSRSSDQHSVLRREASESCPAPARCPPWSRRRSGCGCSAR